MRISNVDGRATIVTAAAQGFDVADASGGQFGPDMPGLYERWAEFRSWADTAHPGQPISIERNQIRIPSPRPRQVFGVGANYAKHIAETQRNTPTDLAIFTKFPSCLAGAYDPVTIRSDRVDWEVELVVVIGAVAERVEVSDGWSYVAGLTVGQDLSERFLQLNGPRGQYSLAKSMPGFGPAGPELVSIDEVLDPDDLELTCTLNGETQQKAKTSDMVFGVAEIISRLSQLCILTPGDLIFTGTPAGVGALQDPPRYLVAGDVLESRIEGIGEMRNVIIDKGERISYL